MHTTKAVSNAKAAIYELRNFRGERTEDVGKEIFISALFISGKSIYCKSRTIFPYRPLSSSILNQTGRRSRFPLLLSFLLSRFRLNGHYKIRSIRVECALSERGHSDAASISLRLMTRVAAEVRAVAFKIRKWEGYETQIQLQSQRIVQRVWRVRHPLPVYGRNLRCVETKADRVAYRPPFLAIFLSIASIPHKA